MDHVTIERCPLCGSELQRHRRNIAMPYQDIDLPQWEPCCHGWHALPDIKVPYVSPEMVTPPLPPVEQPKSIDRRRKQ